MLPMFRGMTRMKTLWIGSYWNGARLLALKPGTRGDEGLAGSWVQMSAVGSYTQTWIGVPAVTSELTAERPMTFLLRSSYAMTKFPFGLNWAWSAAGTEAIALIFLFRES